MRGEIRDTTNIVGERLCKNFTARTVLGTHAFRMKSREILSLDFFCTCTKKSHFGAIFKVKYLLNHEPLEDGGG